MRALTILIVLSMMAFGQRHKAPEEVDAETPAGKLMQQFMQESDAAKKEALYEQFATQFPNDQHTAWVLEMVEGYYVSANQPDQVIAWGDKLLATDPDDTEGAFEALKAAESKKDAALILKYSDTSHRNARKLAATPQPKNAEGAKAWKDDVAYAKQVAQYADYALFRAAAESRDPKETIQLGERLLERSPESEYSAKLVDPLFLAYRQSGANDKAVAFAEKALLKDQTNEDMLLAVADSYLQKKQAPEKVHAYSAKIVEIVSAKEKPAGASDADWTNRKNTILGIAHYMNGKQYAEENKHAQADQELRKALPLIETTPALKPETLFLLGLANYKLASGNPERARDSANFFRSCAAIKSPFQATAATNLKRIMTEYHGIK